MEITFGVPARDGAIKIQIADDKVGDLRKQLDDAFAPEKEGNGTILWVTDTDGREFGIPTEKIAFIEFGTKKEERRVGFSSAD
jgi:hypothetical protein